MELRGFDRNTILPQAVSRIARWRFTASVMMLESSRPAANKLIGQLVLKRVFGGAVSIKKITGFVNHIVVVEKTL